MDELYRYTDEPMFVTEGPLDALSIGRNAVALAGSTLTDFKLQELKRVAKKRRVIFVLDKNSNGKKLGLQVLEHDFYVSIFPNNIEDSNDALKELGRIWINSFLISNAKTKLDGKISVELLCK
jgi:DNA primase